jgi:signal transduction histidine kinase/HAMP domain-containing protein/ActR/RegA family two-component response regulator
VYDRAASDLPASSDENADKAGVPARSLADEVNLVQSIVSERAPTAPRALAGPLTQLGEGPVTISNYPEAGSLPSDSVDPIALLNVLSKVKLGDFGIRAPLEWTGLAGRVADTLNDVIAANEMLETELLRISRTVGQLGKLSQRLALGEGAHTWSRSIESVNSLIEALVLPTSEMQRVIGAVADGDLSKKISANVQGEMLDLKNTINAMVDQLNGFVSELARVAREVGTEGKLGQAAAVTIEVGGVWKGLTDNVNLMARNLTGQVRNIAEVTTAVARGDLSKKISADVQGEFLELKNTINAMVDQLNGFASELTRVAREVGVEGKLGGQAQLKDVGGVWKDLTENVNQLAANLTNQVRAIAEVATAVTEGDLTRQVRVDASGEVAALKDNLNEMIRNLRETTRQNIEQDWLKTNRERFSRMLQGERDLATVSDMILSELAPLVSAQHGSFYSMTSSSTGEALLELQAGYGNEERRHLSSSFRLGQGLVGQCAKEGKRILLTEVPADYIKISSGLGSSPPLNIIVLPILFEGSVRAVVELASFQPFSSTHQIFLDQLTDNIGIVLNTVETNTMTANLLIQSQTQAEELRQQQEELRESNEDLARQAKRLAEQNTETKRRGREIEQAKRLVEEKAGQLAISSTYKSEFIANMSHELRTPLNSLLMLAEQLEDNPDHNMTDTQVEYASVILASGNDLMKLLNNVLDLAKVESGTVTVETTEVSISEFTDDLLREFEPLARDSGVDYSIEIVPDCPSAIVTDGQRLGQILRNLLANAFKFTEHGSVTLQVNLADIGWTPQSASLALARSVVAFSVEDTGIGIDSAELSRIFEAFAQGDGSTARLYGGTGLGLSISRSLVQLLGGELSVTSTLGHGSTFTVYLPSTFTRRGPDTGSEGSDRGRGPQFHLRLDDHPFAGMKVLVVDDDFRNVFALTALLERGQATVVSAEGGAAALAVLAETNDIDTVLMDIMMPGMDGYAAIRAIRQIETHKHLPVIALSGKVLPGERERCMDAGADAYVPKPVTSSQLISAIAPWSLINEEKTR